MINKAHQTTISRVTPDTRVATRGIAANEEVLAAADFAVVKATGFNVIVPEAVAVVAMLPGRIISKG